MNTKFLSNLLGTLLLLLLFSCGSGNINYYDAGKVAKGTKYNDLIQRYSNSYIEAKELLLAETNEKYKFVYCSREIGQGVYDLFVFAFKNDELYFWGNLDDFKTSDDLLNNSLGKLASDYWEQR